MRHSRPRWNIETLSMPLWMPCLLRRRSNRPLRPSGCTPRPAGCGFPPDLPACWPCWVPVIVWAMSTDARAVLPPPPRCPEWGLACSPRHPSCHGSIPLPMSPQVPTMLLAHLCNLKVSPLETLRLLRMDWINPEGSKFIAQVCASACMGFLAMLTQV